MSNPFRGEKISNWVSDFCESADAARLPVGVAEFAQPVLETFMTAACSGRDIEPEELGEEDIRPAFVEGVAHLTLSEDARKGVPDLIAAFLGSLETQGRLGGGATLASYVRAHRRLYEDAARAVVAPIRRETSKLGPNAPCPCGSGRKYKKCCKRLGRT